MGEVWEVKGEEVVFSSNLLKYTYKNYCRSALGRNRNRNSSHQNVLRTFTNVLHKFRRVLSAPCARGFNEDFVTHQLFNALNKARTD